MNSVRNLSINKKSSGTGKILIQSAAFLFVLILSNIFLVPIKNSFYTISAPMQKTLWMAGASSSGFLNSLVKTGSLVKENDNLKNENLKLLAQLSQLQFLQGQLNAENRMAVIGQENGLEYLAAGAIGLEGDGIISLDKGAKNGIKEGMPVVNEEQVVFGKVFKVYDNFSKVMLASHKDSVINVMVQQNEENKDAEIVGIIKGSGDFSAYLDLIPIDKNIDQDDVLITSSIEKFFPRNLLVGKIKSKEKNDQNPFQKADISLFFDIKTADSLFVITNFKQAN